jgi:hypothetical protein
VWRRFASAAPSYYDGVAALLESLDALDLLADPPVWPAANARVEADLREALLKLPEQAHGAACGTVLRLASLHGPRRDAPWDGARQGTPGAAPRRQPCASARHERRDDTRRSRACSEADDGAGMGVRSLPDPP